MAAQFKIKTILAAQPMAGLLNTDLKIHVHLNMFVLILNVKF